MIQLTVKGGTCTNQIHDLDQVFTIEAGFAPTTPAGICVHAWNALAPYIMALILDGRFAWEKDGLATTVCCPDPHGITWEVRRVEDS
jgi:uncharacterized repeat protein (TIGR04076 family)